MGLRTSCRLLPNGEPVYGLAWEINRRLPEREGEWPNFETLMVSKDVFEFETAPSGMRCGPWNLSGVVRTPLFAKPFVPSWNGW